MGVKLLFAVLGILIGWFAEDGVLWVKSKCGLKSSPDDNERERGDDSGEDLEHAQSVGDRLVVDGTEDDERNSEGEQGNEELPFQDSL